MTLLTPQEIAGSLPPGWRHEGDALVHDRTLDDFAGAVAFVDAVAAAAEEADHHPDMLLHGWNKVRLTVSTHSEGGVTERDIALAAAVNGLR